MQIEAAAEGSVRIMSLDHLAGLVFLDGNGRTIHIETQTLGDGEHSVPQGFGVQSHHGPFPVEPVGWIALKPLGGVGGGLAGRFFSPRVDALLWSDG